MALIKHFNRDIASGLIVAVIDVQFVEVCVYAYHPAFDQDFCETFLSAVRNKNDFDTTSQWYFNGTEVVARQAPPSQLHHWDWPTQTWQLDSARAAKVLEGIYNDALTTIDLEAEKARRRYITANPGQEGVYLKKEAQALAWSQSGFTGPAPSYIAAEAEALGVDPQALVATILNIANYWNNDRGPKIEGARRKWKVALDNVATTSPEQIQTVLEQGIAELATL